MKKVLRCIFPASKWTAKKPEWERFPHDDYVILQQLGTMKIADLFRVQQNSSTYNENGDRRTTFYAQSGMLMHYIYDNQLLPKVAIYFDLKENKHLPVEDAIKQAFGMSAAAVRHGFKQLHPQRPLQILSDSYPGQHFVKQLHGYASERRGRQRRAGRYPSAFA